MPERPKFPATLLIAWLGVLANVVALLLLFFPEPPFALRFVVAGVGVSVAGALLIFHLGRWWEWKRFSRETGGS